MPGNTPQPKKGTVVDAHEVLVKILGEIIGVAILAILADNSETMGRVAVGLMLGWLLVFIITQPSLLKGITSKL